MKVGHAWKVALGIAAVGAVVAIGVSPSVSAQAPAAADVTYTKDIAPILQRSCENCHRPDGAGPMALTTYEEVRPWARAIKTRTGIGPHAGVMPPWYMEKNIGIQKYKDDPSLSAEEIAKVAKWADSGAPRGNPADMPPARQYADNSVWRIGKPDLIVRTKDITVKANAPDWWGEIESVPIPLDQDRYVLAVEVKEVNDVDTHNKDRQTVGGRFVWHHLIYRTQVGLDTPANVSEVDSSTSEDTVGWPVHEVGRNPDYFDQKAARLLKKGSYIVSDSAHIHSNGHDTVSHLEFGYKFAPVGYKPQYKRATYSLGNGVDIDITGMEKDSQLHAYAVLPEPTKLVSFEPHLHAPGTRMCLEAIWGYNIQTLSCVGYDHNWVRGYSFADDVQPLLPKGTILHIVGYMNNSPSNKNVPDPRNWQGSGNRSIANMFIDLGNRVFMTEEQFQEEMRARVAANPGKDVLLGCPLCGVVAQQQRAARPTQNQDQQQ
ncbi:MAG TPA: hypothetical protein VM032_05150 [Vicinamibacterales bacterium]|nr:hypothetical protein [Vicinamibacterales bacterium]